MMSLKNKQLTSEPSNNDSAVLHVALLAGFLVALGLTVAILALIPHLVSPSVDLSSLKKLFIIPIDGFKPEPAERLQYLFGAVLFPLLVLSTTLILRRYFLRFATRINFARIRAWLVGCITAASLVLLWYDNASVKSLYIRQNYFFTHPILMLPLFCLSIWVAVIYRRLVSTGGYQRRLARLMVDSVAAVIIICIGAMHVFAASALQSGIRASDHFNAVFYAVSQVQAGRTLLVDLSNQYGLYPHILQPIFAVTGLSVIKFTFTMCVLVAFGMACLYVFLRRSISNPWIAFLGFCGVVYFCYIMLHMTVSTDPYFQYYPIRFLFPAVFIAMSYFYFKKKNNIKYLLVTLLASVAIVWNLDTGVVVFVVWLLVLGYQEFLANDAKHALYKTAKHILFGLTVLTVCLGLSVFYLAARSGNMPNIGAVTAYQKYFILYGFNMIPMPAIAPWNAVVLIYGAGLTYAIKALIQKNGAEREKAIFLLSVLGIGLFSYYQGRSHDWVLPPVIYPAILLIALAADGSLAAFRYKQRSTYPSIVVFAATMFFLSSTFFSLIPSIYILYESHVTTLYQLRDILTGERQSTSVTEGIAYIDKRCRSGEPVLILSYNAGVYYAESKTVNPLSGPGLIELFLRRDYNALISAIETQKINKIFLDRSLLDRNIDINRPIAHAVIKAYDARGASPSGEIIMYERAAAISEPKTPSMLLPESSFAYLHLRNSSSKHVLLGGGRIYFSGTNLSKLEPGTSRTVELIIYPEPKQCPGATILSDSLYVNDCRGINMQLESGKTDSYSLTLGDGIRWYVSDGIRIPAGQWHYLALVIEGNRYTLFRDGLPVSGKVTQDSIKDANQPLFIGNSLTADRPFNGSVEEIRVSDRSLSDLDIENNAKNLREPHVFK
jgi:hypothetical protein